MRKKPRGLFGCLFSLIKLVVLIGILIMIYIGYGIYKNIKRVETYRSQVENLTKQYQIEGYETLALAIIYTESKGRGIDLMQSSESLTGEQALIDPGPAKLAKAESYNIANISEDEFLDLILTKSGMPARYVKGTTNTDEQIEKSSKKSEEPVKQRNTNIKKENIVKKTPEKATITKVHTEVKHEHVKEIKSEKLDVDIIKKEVSIKKHSFYGEDLITKGSNEENKKIVKENKTTSISTKNLSWADKYKPTDIKSIIGQQGDKSCMRKLLYWLNNWQKNHLGKDKPKLVKPSPWNKSDDGAFYKCALLSGPPGIGKFKSFANRIATNKIIKSIKIVVFILFNSLLGSLTSFFVGKTTTATLVAKELGYDIVEFNASDTRSKRLLHEEVSQLLSTNSLADFVKGSFKLLFVFYLPYLLFCGMQNL